MRIKLWGVRGSTPVPLTSEIIEGKIRKALTMARPGDVSSPEAVEAFIRSLPLTVRGTYGGNTSALQVVTDGGDLILLDCGSGIINLGKEMMKGDFGHGKGVASVFMTHTHWDHIQGIPFFLPIYIPGNRFNFYSPMKDLRKRLDHQQVKTHFPIDLDYMAAEKHFFTLEPEEEFYLNETRILNKRMNHPGGAFGYRIEERGKSFVYTGDCEFNLEAIDRIASYRDFFANADVVVFDTQYTFEESMDKYDWGHSSASIAIDIAGKFNVRKLVLFHHDPDYSEEKLESVFANARTYLKLKAERIGNLEVEIAVEGMEFNL